MSHYVQIELATATITSVLTKVAALIEASDTAVGLDELRSLRHPVVRLLDSVAMANRVSPSSLLEWARSDPGRVRSCVETRVEVRKRVSLALREVK